MGSSTLWWRLAAGRIRGSILRLVCRRRSETPKLRISDRWLPRWAAAMLRHYVVGCAICIVAMAAGRAQEGASTSRSVWDGVYTEEQATRGEEIYRKECASCHGDTLAGGGGGAPLNGGGILFYWKLVMGGGLFYRNVATIRQRVVLTFSREQG